MVTLQSSTCTVSNQIVVQLEKEAEKDRIDQPVTLLWGGGGGGGGTELGNYLIVLFCD